MALPSNRCPWAARGDIGSQSSNCVSFLQSPCLCQADDSERSSADRKKQKPICINMYQRTWCHPLIIGNSNLDTNAWTTGSFSPWLLTNRCSTAAASAACSSLDLFLCFCSFCLTCAKCYSQCHQTNTGWWFGNFNFSIYRWVETTNQ